MTRNRHGEEAAWHASLSGVRGRAPCRTMVRTDSDFCPIRDDPGFQALIADPSNPLGGTP